MSRIGKQPIQIPAGVEVTFDADTITVTGPKGNLSIKRPPLVKIDRNDEAIIVSIPEKETGNRQYNSYHGLTRSLIYNMVLGVTTGFKKELEMKGIGYRAQLQGETLVLNVGYSHQVVIPHIDGITYSVSENTNISIEGISKELVGQVAANIRKVRPPEPYKGKGIKYKDEVIRRKAGKSSKGGKGAK